MNTWNNALREGLLSGTLASLLSTAALAVTGRRETGHAAAPTNAVSHWLWDQEALHENRPTLRHTLVGYLVHHGAAVMWATLYAKLRRQGAANEPLEAATGAATTAAVAAFVDFKLTPERLTPGFEHRLSVPSLVAVYALFAAGIALGAMAMDDSDFDSSPQPWH
jgi:hypothetical protein